MSNSPKREVHTHCLLGRTCQLSYGYCWLLASRRRQGASPFSTGSRPRCFPFPWDSAPSSPPKRSDLPSPPRGARWPRRRRGRDKGKCGGKEDSNTPAERRRRAKDRGDPAEQAVCLRRTMRRKETRREARKQTPNTARKAARKEAGRGQPARGPRERRKPTRKEAGKVARLCRAQPPARGPSNGAREPRRKSTRRWAGEETGTRRASVMPAAPGARRPGPGGEAGRSPGGEQPRRMGASGSSLRGRRIDVDRSCTWSVVKGRSIEVVNGRLHCGQTLKGGGGKRGGGRGGEVKGVGVAGGGAREFVCVRVNLREKNLR